MHGIILFIKVIHENKLEEGEVGREGERERETLPPLSKYRCFRLRIMVFPSSSLHTLQAYGREGEEENLENFRLNANQLIMSNSIRGADHHDYGVSDTI